MHYASEYQDVFDVAFGSDGDGINDRRVKKEEGVSVPAPQ